MPLNRQIMFSFPKVTPPESWKGPIVGYSDTLPIALVAVRSDSSRASDSWAGWRYQCSRWDRYLGMTAAMTQVPVPTATQVKRFCKYDGTPIRSKKAFVCSKSYSSTVSPKGYKIIEKAKKEYPKEYASFLKFNKDMTNSIQIDFTVESEEIARSIPKLFREKIALELSDKFTSDELFEVMERNSCPFKLNKPLVSRILNNKPIITLMLF